MTKKSSEQDDESIDNGPAAPDFDELLNNSEDRSQTDKIMERLENDEDIDNYTEYVREEINAVQSLDVLAEQHEGLDLLKRWLLGYKKKKVSLARKGRGEVVKMAAPSISSEVQNRQNDGFFSKLKPWS